jgi:hypothetical protein
VRAIIEPAAETDRAAVARARATGSRRCRTRPRVMRGRNARPPLRSCAQLSSIS